MNSSTSTYAFSVGKGISHGILKALHTSKQPLKEERTHSISFLEHGAAMWPILTYYLSSLSGRLTRKKKNMHAYTLAASNETGELSDSLLQDTSGL